MLDVLRRNADEDPFLRHGAVMGLAGIGDIDALLAAADDRSAAVRMGVLLALRRLRRAEVAWFLADADPLLVLEAARAVHDVPIMGGMRKLASVLDRRGVEDKALLRRAISASFQLGGEERIALLTAFVARKDVADDMRIEALRAMRDWIGPTQRDRVQNLWRPLPRRSAAALVAALYPVKRE